MPVGKTRDSGWQIGVSRTVPLTPEEVWARIEDTSAWLGEETDDVRSHRPLDRIRVGWDGTIVQVAITKAKTGTTVRFHQEHLADAEHRERQRAHWSAVIDRLFG
jgi:hypothetical protein